MPESSNTRVRAARVKRRTVEEPVYAPVFAYEIERSGVLKAALPEGASLAIVSRKRYPTKKFRSGALKIKKIDTLWKRSPAAAPPKVSADAFQPDARGRALLRGVKLVEDDLRASGGAYSLDQVQELMRISRQAINSRIHAGTLLAVAGPSNRAAYPVAQFLQDGTPVAGLKEVRDALGTSNSWMLLNFLVNAEPKLGGSKPIELLKAGKVKDVVEAARRAGVQGA